MCRAIETIAVRKFDEGEKKGDMNRAIKVALAMLNDKVLPLGSIAKYTELPLSEVESLAKTLPT